MPDQTPVRPRIFLDRVHLKGYKSIENLSIDFQKGLNILIGKNGSGKSNFMEFLFEAVDFVRTPKSTYKYAKLEFSSTDKHFFTIELENKFQDIKIEIGNLDERIILVEKITIDNKIYYDSSKDDLSRSFIFNNKKIIFRNGLGNLFRQLGYNGIYPFYIKYNLPDKLECLMEAGTLKIDTKNPFTPWDIPDTIVSINDVFWRFEAIYEGWSLSRKKAINQTDLLNEFAFKNEIVENLKLFSLIEDVRFNTNMNLYADEKIVIIDNIKVVFKIDGKWHPWSELSDGTKRLFYIISEVTNGYGLILIEEPELGVHPHQFHLLMNFLKEQSENKQIIISTHAPKALDHLTQKELKNIILTSYDSKKGTQMRHLTPKEVKKAITYIKEVGFFSDYWLMSDLEE